MITQLARREAAKGRIGDLTSASQPRPIVPAGTPAEPHPFTAAGLIPGAFLALYAFLGFEDMVNLAKRRAIPRWLPVRRLAEYTSTLVLVIFVLVNASLIAIKRADPVQEGVRSIPSWVPVVGVLTTLPMLLYVCWQGVSR